MNPSPVGSQMSSDTSGENSSVRKGTDYDEVFGLGHESEGSSSSSERETLAQSPDEEVESYREESEEGVVSEEGDVEEEEEERDSDGGGDEGGEESCEGTSGSPGGNCPFILLDDWAVNKFLPKMSDRVFKDCVPVTKSETIFQSIYLEKNEQCYTRRIADVDMYDAMLVAGLRLPLMALHRQSADLMGLSVNRIASNA